VKANLALIMALLLVGATGCASLEGEVREGVYVSPSEYFAVPVPPLPDVKIHEWVASEFEVVDFASGGFDAMTPAGVWSVLWTDDWIHTGRAEDVFLGRCRDHVEAYLRWRINEPHTSWSILDVTPTRHDGHPAYRFLVEVKPGRGGTELLAGTAVLIGTARLQAVLLTPVPRGSSTSEAWSTYRPRFEDFLASIHPGPP